MPQTWLILLALVFSVFFFTGKTSAGNGEYGRYLGVRLIGAYAEVQDTAASNFNGALKINNDTDLTAGTGITFGYRWKSLPLRTEIELAYRFRFDHDLRDNGSPNQGYENNLATLSALFNAAYEYRNSSDFVPYFGGSLGWAQNHSVVDRDNLSTGAEEEFNNREHNFAWGLVTGVTWHFAKHWDTEVGYRFINLGKVDSSESNIGTKFSADDYISHDVLITLNYRF